MRTSATVETLVFDLFGVLISFDNERVYARLAAHCERPRQALTRLTGLMARALALGFRAHWFRGVTGLIADLRALGLV